MHQEKIDTGEQQDAGTFAEKMAAVKSVALNVFDFLKEHWKIEAIVVTVIVVAVAAFNFIPVIPVNNMKLVNLGASTRLESGQVVKLKSGNVSVEVSHFTEACPTGQTCFGNGAGVEYMLTVDGQKYATGSLKPENTSDYRVKTVSTDYKTYAEIQLASIKQ